MKKNLITFLIGVILGIIICLVVFVITTDNYYDAQKTYGLLEIIYYISQPIGIFVTFLAVIVAIFNNEIRNIIYYKSCKVTLEKDGFIENLGKTEDSNNPVAQSYDCIVNFHNNGSRELTNVQLQIKSIDHLKLHSKKYHSLHVVQNQILYWWTSDKKKIDIPVKDTKKLCLARINPASSSETPDGNKKSPLCISIMGHNLTDSYNKEGSWKITYALYSDNILLKSFILTIFWNGGWRNRLTEMTNEVSAIINYK